ncbi:polymerase basic 1 protein [Quaranjavirus johnstonense]|uniref:RNA-directed RNA polymerase catalytic subunit n=1 Tax=Quaranjavirus johnstonense TaxID=688437 RepID=D0QX28_9ORTO|nr:polymerase basic 1 protein [Quaranjavirus johnstonense]ACY56284.1 polymerase PB1 [Quaranjavirus johnstonense]QHR77126.1 polymerase basic 1 protein [Quaranjavirus johnstonense]
MANLSSFLVSTLLREGFSREEKERLVGPYPVGIENTGLGAISFLYKYVNVPPLAVGAPASKTAESVLRSFEYNRLPNNGKGSRPRQYWMESDGPFPFDVTSANFHLGAAQEMHKEFLMANHQAIDRVTEFIYQKIKVVNADILTKGKQTWDPINMRSVPSAAAFKEVMSIFRTNIKVVGFSVLDFLEAFHKMMGLQEMVYNRRVTEEKVVRKRKGGVVTLEKKMMVVAKTEHVQGNEEVRRIVMGWATSFCSYLKSKERGKLKRRAIASANPILRMFLWVVEEFHLEFGKQEEVTSSTISIGGEEKRSKIITTLDSLSLNEFNLQATEDATKWNECLAPENFCLMHEMWWSHSVRQSLGLPLPSENSQIMRQIFQQAFFLLSNKRIYLGKGHLIHNQYRAALLQWKEEHERHMNKKTLSWFREIKEHLDSEGYVRAPFGMLMGMLNAGSTTLALPATNWRLRSGMDCKTVRSSDDSMTVFSGATRQLLMENVNRFYDNLKLLGVNISSKKTRFFQLKFGEYTSAYQDGDFTAQYGVETAALRPEGSNPPDDFHSVASQTATSLRAGTVNFVGAQFRLGIGVDNVRRLYKIDRVPNKRIGVPDFALVLSDGGPSPWNFSNCHLPEMALKWVESEGNEAATKYLEKVMNPDNPFTAEASEITSFSRELNTLVDTSLELPRNLFHTLKRSNATQRSLLRKEDNDFMRACNVAMGLFEEIIPASLLQVPSGPQPMSGVMADVMRAQVSALRTMGVVFSDEEMEEIGAALTALEHESNIDFE